MAEVIYYREYETVFIIRPDLEDTAVDAIIDRIKGVIKDREGIITKMENWGVRQMTYEIMKNTSGRYGLIQYGGLPKVVAEIERTFKMLEPVMKFMTIRLRDAIKPEEFTAIEDPTFTTMKTTSPESQYARFDFRGNKGRGGRDDGFDGGYSRDRDGDRGDRERGDRKPPEADKAVEAKAAPEAAEAKKVEAPAAVEEPTKSEE